MKANRGCIDRSEEGVSNVLGGIMFFALVFLFVATIQVTYVPVWEEDREADHAQNILAQLAVLKSEADRQAGNRTDIPSSNPLTLGDRASSRLFVSASLPGIATFVPGNADQVISTSEFKIIEQNGREYFGVDESWNSISSGATVEDVASLKHMRIRLDDPGNEADGDSISMEITDANNQFAGRLTAYIAEHPSGYSIMTRVENANNVVIYDQGESSFQQNKPPFYWIDAFSSELQFIDVVEAAAAPFDLTLTEVGLSGAYSIAYTEDQDGTQVTVGGSGKLLANFTRTYDSGHLDVSLRPAYFPEQRYRFENGAVLLTQDETSMVRIEPSISISKGTTSTKVVMTIPSLSGQGDSISQPGAITVSLNGRSETNLVGSMPYLSYTLNTEFAALWATYLSNELDEAGLDSNIGEYEISTTATSVQLDIYGTNTDPASTIHDLYVELHQANIDLRIQT